MTSAFPASAAVAPHQDQHKPAATGASNARGTSLFPLFLIVGYILGVTVLIEVGAALAGGGWSAERAMRHFMAGFFLVFSFFKMFDVRGFVRSYLMYDVIARFQPRWAWAYPFIELVLGVAYLLNVAPLVVNGVTLVLMLVGALGVLLALRDKKQIRCACLGSVLNLPMTTVTLVEDLAMAAMAAGMIVLHVA